MNPISVKISVKWLNCFLSENEYKYAVNWALMDKVALYCKLKELVCPDRENIYIFLSNQRLGSKTIIPYKKAKPLTNNKRVKKKKLARETEAKERRREEYHLYLKSPKWKAKRKIVLEERRYTCERCGAKPKVHLLHVHHKTYKHIFEEPLTDLELLCKPCHEKEHEKKTKSKES